jgi:DNA-binding PadR family transcriptional regulator
MPESFRHERAVVDVGPVTACLRADVFHYSLKHGSNVDSCSTKVPPHMATRTRTPESLLPLTQPVFGILLALEDKKAHGYGIMQALADKTGGRQRLLPGSLYASIARMIDDGLVEEVDAPARETSGGPARRYYRRTAFGKAVAQAETERMRQLVKLAMADKLVGGSSR